MVQRRVRTLVDSLLVDSKRSVAVAESMFRFDPTGVDVLLERSVEIRRNWRNADARHGTSHRCVANTVLPPIYPERNSSLICVN